MAAKSILWILFLGATAATLVILPPFTPPWLPLSSSLISKSKSKSDVVCQEEETTSFYDDPTTTYTIDHPITEWDEKRSHWFKLHPSLSPSDNRVLVVTGSQPSPCKSAAGDHFLLRFFKNKVDYCRMHGYSIFYNNADLHAKEKNQWAKLAAVRAAMVAHPEAEWLFWVDSDALFSDMDFEVPFERYEDRNLVVHGWPELVHVNRSWLSVNSGVFLLRNCGWSMEFLDVWAGMGPMGPGYEEWVRVVTSALRDVGPGAYNDQSALVYQVLEGEERWREKIHVENGYLLNSYWLMTVGGYDEIRRKYGEMEEEREAGLRRRHAEGEGTEYAAERGRRAEEGGWRRPFVTHFTGCQPCSGWHNPAYEGDTCTVGMERALNFADDQVLRNYGFVHPDLGNASPVTPLPF